MSFLDLTNVESNKVFDALPAGDYVVACDEAEVKKTKAGTGEYINMGLKVIEGEFEGRRVFATFNIVNPSEKAVQIGLGQLKDYMKASQMDGFKLDNVKDLLGRRVVAHVKQETGDDSVVRNRVTYFKPATTSPF